MLKLVFYYNHYNTLGHSTRVFSLVKGLKEYFKEKIEIIVLQGGKRQQILPFNRYSRVYLIPYCIDKKGLFIEENTRIYREIISSGKLDNMFKERMSFMRNILDEFKPNIFITEYFPFGQEFWTFEVPYLLRYLKNNFVCKIIGSCGYVSYIDNAYEYIKEFYDCLFIHSPPEFSKDYGLYLHKKGVENLDRIFNDFSNKIHFTGFVRNNFKTNELESIRITYQNLKHNKLIFVSRGGGIVNKKIILVSILLAKENSSLFFVICCGPATTSREFQEYKKISQGIKNLKLVKTLTPSRFCSYLKSADLSINMAGYNTTVKMLYYGKKTILIPYYTTEQRWRADIVQKYLPSRIIEEQSLNISLLSKNVSELLESNGETVKIDKNWFSGVSDTIKVLKCLL